MKKRVTRKDLSFERTHIGLLVISALIGEYLETRRYMYHTKREATQMFLDEFNNQKEAT